MPVPVPVYSARTPESSRLASCSFDSDFGFDSGFGLGLGFCFCFGFGIELEQTSRYGTANSTRVQEQVQ